MQITTVVAALFLLATAALVSSDNPKALQLQVTNGTPFLMRCQGLNMTLRKAEWAFPDNPNFQAKQSSTFYFRQYLVIDMFCYLV